jgi:hypothetical protein
MPIDRSRSKKGVFLTSTSVPDGYVVKRKPLPANLEQFEAAAAVADELAEADHKSAAAVAEIARRLEMVRKQLADFKKRK